MHWWEGWIQNTSIENIQICSICHKNILTLNFGPYACMWKKLKFSAYLLWKECVCMDRSKGIEEGWNVEAIAI
jgi:hypothetical protein